MELNKTFIDGLWSKEINVTSFVQTNITPYLGKIPVKQDRKQPQMVLEPCGFNSFNIAWNPG